MQDVQPLPYHLLRGEGQRRPDAVQRLQQPHVVVRPPDGAADQAREAFARQQGGDLGRGRRQR